MALSASSVPAVPAGGPWSGQLQKGPPKEQQGFARCGSAWEPEPAGLGALPVPLGGDCVAQLAEGLAWPAAPGNHSHSPSAGARSSRVPASLPRTGATRPPSELAIPALLSCCFCLRLVCVHVVVLFLFFF